MVVEPDAPRHRHRGLGADFRVVARVPLADVVQQRAQQQEIRPCAARNLAVETLGIADRRALGDRLERMTVDGEPVVRVALRSCAHMLPLRQ